MNEPSPALSRLMVRKRDGQLDPFSVAKIIDCLRRCLQEANDVDPPATAEGLADAAVQFLLKNHPDGVVPASRLSELVELVLNETGYTAAALSHRQNAYRRERLRRQLHVAHYRSKQGRYVNRRWSKSAMVASLQTQHQLGRGTARRIAGIVEWNILRSGMHLVTTALIEQAIVSELLAWGLAPAAFVVSRRGRRPAAQPPVRFPADP